MQPFPIVAGDLGIPGAATADHTLTNLGPGTPTAGDLGASFEKAIHRYNAIEVTADGRFADRWALQASYRYSRLRGTFEGFFRDVRFLGALNVGLGLSFSPGQPPTPLAAHPVYGNAGEIPEGPRGSELRRGYADELPRAESRLRSTQPDQPRAAPVAAAIDTIVQ